MAHIYFGISFHAGKLTLFQLIKEHGYSSKLNRQLATSIDVAKNWTQTKQNSLDLTLDH